MSEDKQEALFAAPIEWDSPENIITRYSNNLIVQNTGHEFILSFFEIRPPILLGSVEEQKQQALEIKSVKAECVARVVISAERMSEFLQVLQDNFSKYQAKLDQSE